MLAKTGRLCVAQCLKLRLPLKLLAYAREGLSSDTLDDPTTIELILLLSELERRDRPGKSKRLSPYTRGGDKVWVLARRKYNFTVIHTKPGSAAQNLFQRKRQGNFSRTATRLLHSNAMWLRSDAQPTVGVLQKAHVWKVRKAGFKALVAGCVRGQPRRARGYVGRR